MSQTLATAQVATGMAGLTVYATVKHYLAVARHDITPRRLLETKRLYVALYPPRADHRFTPTFRAGFLRIGRIGITRISFIKN